MSSFGREMTEMAPSSSTDDHTPAPSKTLDSSVASSSPYEQNGLPISTNSSQQFSAKAIHPSASHPVSYGRDAIQQYANLPITFEGVPFPPYGNIPQTFAGHNTPPSNGLPLSLQGNSLQQTVNAFVPSNQLSQLSTNTQAILHNINIRRFMGQQNSTQGSTNIHSQPQGITPQLSTNMHSQLQGTDSHASGTIYPQFQGKPTQTSIGMCPQSQGTNPQASVTMQPERQGHIPQAFMYSQPQGTNPQLSINMHSQLQGHNSQISNGMYSQANLQASVTMQSQLQGHTSQASNGMHSQLQETTPQASATMHTQQRNETQASPDFHTQAQGGNQQRAANTITHVPQWDPLVNPYYRTTYPIKEAMYTQRLQCFLMDYLQGHAQNDPSCPKAGWFQQFKVTEELIFHKSFPMEDQHMYHYGIRTLPGLKHVDLSIYVYKDNDVMVRGRKHYRVDAFAVCFDQNELMIECPFGDLCRGFLSFMWYNDKYQYTFDWDAMDFGELLRLLRRTAMRNFDEYGNLRTEEKQLKMDEELGDIFPGRGKIHPPVASEMLHKFTSGMINNST